MSEKCQNAEICQKNVKSYARRFVRKMVKRYVRENIETYVSRKVSKNASERKNVRRYVRKSTKVTVTSVLVSAEESSPPCYLVHHDAISGMDRTCLRRIYIPLNLFD